MGWDTFTGTNLIHNAPFPPHPMLKIKLKKLPVHHSTFNIEWRREKGVFVTLFCLNSSLFQVNNKTYRKVAMSQGRLPWIVDIPGQMENEVFKFWPLFRVNEEKSDSCIAKLDIVVLNNSSFYC